MANNCLYTGISGQGREEKELSCYLLIQSSSVPCWRSINWKQANAPEKRTTCSWQKIPTIETGNAILMRLTLNECCIKTFSLVPWVAGRENVFPLCTLPKPTSCYLAGELHLSHWFPKGWQVGCVWLNEKGLSFLDPASLGLDSSHCSNGLDL